LEENKGVDDGLLLQLYLSAKNYKKAYLLANLLYKETGEIDYLGQSAIFEYDNHHNKNNRKMQKQVIKKLEKVVKSEENPLYLNYLGYLLIDHNIDIKGGMKYIKRALKLEPNSAFYLDSLAWGYYKLGAYKKAYHIIKKATKLKDGDNKEVLEHFKKIKYKLYKKGRHKK
jgi:tetratricopeptide (TPR) repeat protein